LKFIKHQGEVYVEFSSFKDFALSVLKCVGFAIIGGVAFYALWILSDLLK